MVATTLRQTILYLAIELSNSKWKLFFSNGEKIRSKSISARDLDGLSQEIEAAKKRFKLNEDVSVISCYEAGRDGFWIHRHLTAIGGNPVAFPYLEVQMFRVQGSAQPPAKKTAGQIEIETFRARF